MRDAEGEGRMTTDDPDAIVRETKVEAATRTEGATAGEVQGSRRVPIRH
jgi:hypothetical protein